MRNRKLTYLVSPYGHASRSSIRRSDFSVSSGRWLCKLQLTISSTLTCDYRDRALGISAPVSVSQIKAED